MFHDLDSERYRRSPEFKRISEARKQVESAWEDLDTCFATGSVENVDHYYGLLGEKVAKWKLACKP